MRLSIRTTLRISLSALAAGVLLTNGCALPHAPLRPTNENIGQVSPLQFCPGDTITANFNLTQEQACVSRPGLDCATLAPTITIASTPMSFAPQTTTAFSGRVDFVPAGDSVNVQFSAASAGLAYPVVNMDGTPGLRIRNLVNNAVETRRITGEITRTIDHGGMCVGGNPVNADGVVPGPPELSSNLRMHRICNTSAVPVRIQIGGFAGDMLAPGGCLDLAAPGVPAELGMARTYSVFPLAVDPGAQCASTQGMTPPASLQTTVALGCGQ